jgi:hypothetical protein
MTVRQGGPGGERPVWVQPFMEWPAIDGVKARLEGPTDHVPAEIGGVTLSNAGHQLLACWLETRGPNAMPGAGDVNPRTLVELMPYIRYLSWESEEKLVIRIFGSALAEGAGADLTGCDIFSPGHAEVEIDRARLKMLHAQPCGLLMIRDVHDRSGKTYPCEFMTLPVAPAADGKKRIIGTVVPAVRMKSWDAEVDLGRIFTLRRAVYFDTGAGVPPSSLGLEV